MAYHSVTSAPSPARFRRSAVGNTCLSNARTKVEYSQGAGERRKCSVGYKTRMKEIAAIRLWNCESLLLLHASCAQLPALRCLDPVVRTFTDAVNDCWKSLIDD